MTGLTSKQLLFAQGIAAGKTQRQAATDAGYANPDVDGSRLLRVDKVAKYLETLTGNAVAKAEAKVERGLAKVVEKLWEQADGTEAAEWESVDGIVSRRKYKPQAALERLLDFYAP